MADKINVISADLYGKQLRETKNKNRYYVRCGGKGDNEQIQDALNTVGRMSMFISAEVWERIFGSKK
jgi:hypothetical protein